MNVLNDFVFFDSATSTGESNILHNPNRGSILTLEVQGSGTFSLTLQGLVNKKIANPSYSTLAAIDISDYSVPDAITKSGIYCFGVDGVNDIKAVISSISGSVTVFGRIGE